MMRCGVFGRGVLALGQFSFGFLLIKRPSDACILVGLLDLLKRILILEGLNKLR
jgi:hypothetical protein